MVPGLSGLHVLRIRGGPPLFLTVLALIAFSVVHAVAASALYKVPWVVTCCGPSTRAAEHAARGRGQRAGRMAVGRDDGKRQMNDGGEGSRGQKRC
eukprot:573147-Pelagomonas_calceolata.AAC.5